MLAHQGPPPTFMHPFSATCKSRGAHPDFSLENRRPKLASPLSPSVSHGHLSKVDLPLIHPDEEKGRKHRSSASQGSLQFSIKVNGDNTTTYTPAQPQVSKSSAGVRSDNEDDDGFLEDWLEERSSTKESAPTWPTIPFILAKETATDWSSAIDNAVNNAEERIVLSDVGLTCVPDQVWELSTIRVLDSSANTSVSRSGFLRTISTPFLPASSPQASPTDPTTSRRRLFSKTQSESASRTAGRIQLFLAKNALKTNSLSYALFSLTNLTVLSLRDNKLERLPEGIGRLTGLVELNISLNQIQYLPAEILNLPNLIQLFLHPNPFLVAGPLDKRSTQTGRVVGPKSVHYTVPSLSESIIRLLLTEADQESSRLRHNDLPGWVPDHLRAPFHTILHPLQSSSSFSSHSRSYSNRSKHSQSHGMDEIDVKEHQQPFDPLSNICQSIAHPGEERYFYTHAVERIEWVSETTLKKGIDTLRGDVSSTTITSEDGKALNPLDFETKNIPIRHRGCGSHCLDWLDD